MTTYYISDNFCNRYYLLTNHNDPNDTIVVLPTYTDHFFLCDHRTGEIFDATNVTNYDEYLAAHMPAVTYSYT